MLYVFALAVGLFFFGCGGGSDKKTAPAPSDPKFGEVKAIVDANCGGCHNDKGQRAFNGTNFKASNAAARIKDGSMPPPPKRLSGPDKDALLGYLEG